MADAHPPARTRFAPSPTGFQHIGGFRTAFYAWLLAKKTGGQFILRIEDTDQERLVAGAIKYIVEELAWFGIVPDEGPSRDELSKIGESLDGGSPNLSGDFGPYIQSQRLSLYKEYADRLIASGHAYRCDCTPEMLERERNEQMARKESPGYSGYCRDRNVSADAKHVVRFKMPFKPHVVMEDAIRGKIIWDNPPLRDTVLLKSDGFPTYHLAVVVDDTEMKVTHVMRGEEWLATAPLHCLLYDAFGLKRPVFAHLPVVKGSDGKKLSKRHGATFTSAFREEGYLPEALLNYVVLVGWSPGEGDNQEVFTREELFSKFSLEHINEASAVFDYNKLQWMNGVYIRNLSVDDFVVRVTPFLEKAGLSVDESKLRAISHSLQDRIRTLAEAAPMVEFLFKENIEPDWASLDQKKGLDLDTRNRVLATAKEKLNSLSGWAKDDIETALHGVATDLNLKQGPVMQVIRVAVTGKLATPPLAESIAVLDKALVLGRLNT